LRKSTPHLIAFWGQHKCGSNWINRITEAVATRIGLRYEKFSRPTEFDRDLPAHVARNGLQCVSWVNAEHRMIKDLDYRAYHVVRDPRDILVSAYFSHLKTHPTDRWPRLAEFRPKLQAVSKDEGLMMEFDFIKDVFRRLREWDLSDQRTLTLRLEDISPDPPAAFRRAFEFVGFFDAGLSEWGFKRIMKRFRFEKMSGGRRRGVENRDSHFRKGEHGDWKNHFTAEHTAYFKAQLNDILVKYGYERGDAW
jgi:hypothetical protein